MTDPARFHLTTPLPSACTDEALPGRAQPALLAVNAAASGEGDGGDALSFTVAVRARLAPPDRHSCLGSVATVALPPPLVVAVCANVSMVARAGGSLAWGVPAPGGKGERVVAGVTAGAAVLGAGLMLASLARAWAAASATAPRVKEA